MTAARDLPRIEDLPLPDDVRVGPGWTDQMREMADHIGARPTLLIIAARGGEQVYVSQDPGRSPFRDIITGQAAATIAHVYGGNRLLVPIGRAALARARRAGVLAAVRAGGLTGADAARILGTSRTYLAHLVNQTDEGRDGAAITAADALPDQLDLFAGR